MRNSNRQWRLASYPEGMPQEENWALSEGPVPDPGHGEMLVRAIYLDVAPYMRARISPQKNYAGGVKIGDVMVGGAIGEVVRSTRTRPTIAGRSSLSTCSAKVTASSVSATRSASSEP